MARWAEYFEQLFMMDSLSKQIQRAGLQTLDGDSPIDETASSTDDVKEALAKLKDGKAAAICNIRAKLLKVGDEAIIRLLPAFLTALWHLNTIPP